MARPRELEPDMIVGVYKKLMQRHGYTSCAHVARHLDKIGFRMSSGRVPTRQGIYYVMAHHPEGRALLVLTKKRIGRE